MRARIALACLVGVVLGACSSSSDPTPALNITPNGMVTVAGPTTFTAELVNLSGDVTWAVDGGGSVSSMTGLHIIYTPPPGTGSATLTATVGSVTSSVMITSGPAVVSTETIPSLTAPVTVLYDAQDIPHIKCATIADCLAVQGYLQARDRFFPMDFLRHVARARLAELIGLGGLSQDLQLRALFTTRAGHRLEDDLTAALDPNTAALITAYVAGVNARIAELRKGAALPGEYGQLLYPISAADPIDLPDWTTQDTLAIARLQQFQLSSTLTDESANGQFLAVYGQGPLQDLGKVNAWIRSAAPTSEQAHTLSPTASRPPAAQRPGALPKHSMAGWQDVLRQTAAGSQALDLALRPANAAVGSNNWAISAAKSATGKAMVANDPHLSLQYPPLFHLAAMTSAKASDNLDLTGGSFPGLPGALVGRGAHVGWGVTVVGYDVTDLYLEQFLPQAMCPGADAGPPCVLFNGAPVSALPVPQTYKVRTGTGGASLVDANTLLPAGSKPPPFVLIIPHHGPIIQAPDALGKAVSARWTGQEGNTQDIKAILGLNTAVDVNAAITALKGFSTGAQNFVLADDQGHIAYDPHALVPRRRFTETTPVPPQNLPWFPLPGDGSAEWGDGVHDCAAATATPVDAGCWLADDQLPHGTDPDKGYFFTANADPTATGATDDNDPMSPQPYLSFNWDDSSGFRATRIEQRIAAAIAANGKVSLADMESIQADHVSRPGQLFAPIIAALPAGAADLTAAQKLIADWGAAGFDCPSGLTGSDPKASAVDATPAVATSSAGCMLFHAFIRALVTNVFTDDLAVAKQGVNGLSALKAIIFMLDPATPPEQTTFCNNVGATGALVTAHTCPEQVAIALAQAYGSLTRLVGPSSTWVWGRVHTMQPVSLLSLVTTGFQPGPFARPGGAFTVDVGTPSLSGSGLDFSFTSSGNVRHISLMDPAKPVVRMQLPGPERDTAVTGVGPDLLGEWVNNTYFDYAFGAQIDSIAVSTQSFKAP
jgi:penicillin amidase